MIVELKCLEKNPGESADWPVRLSKAFRSTGHNFSDLMGYLVRGNPMPDKARKKLISWLRESIRETVKTANRQVRSTKRILEKGQAKGVLLVANDNNYGFTPEGMISILGDAAIRLNDSHLDAVVYFTPNVFHRKPDSDVAWHIWHPVYREPENAAPLQEFINDLGRQWNEYVSIATGDPFVEKEELPNAEFADQAIKAMLPVRGLGRSKKVSGA